MVRRIGAGFAHLGLQRRIMLYVTAGLAIFSAVYGLLALRAIQQSTDFVFHERLLVAQVAADDVDVRMSRIQAQLEAVGAGVAAASAANHWTDAEGFLNASFGGSMALYGAEPLYSLLVMDASRRVIWKESSIRAANAGDDIARSTLPNLSELVSTTVATGTAFDSSGSRVVHMVVPVWVGKAVVGFVVGEIRPDDIAGQWHSSSLVESSRVLEIIDRAGALVASSQVVHVTSMSSHLPLVWPLWQAGRAGIVEHPLPSGGHVVAFVPLQRFPWAVLLEQDEDEVLALPRRLLVQLASLGLLALAGALGLAWFTTRAVVRPITVLIRASQAIASGQLDHPLDVSGEDEVGILSRSFDEMKAKLKQSREEIARWNSELEARVGQRTRELAALVASSNALTSTLDLDVLFGILMKETREVLPAAEGVALLLYDEAAQALTARSSYGFDADGLKPLRLQPGEAIAGQVFETRAPQLLRTPADVSTAQQNLSAENSYHFQRAVADREVQSALGVPVVSKGQCLGVLVVYSFRHAASFGDREAPLLQALADQAATALDNARLYSELREKEAVRAHLLEKVILAQEEERKRIARDLHDDLAQTLAALTIDLQSVVRALPPNADELRNRLSQSQQLATQTLKGINQWILDLRPTVLDDLGLVPAVRWYAESRLAPAGTVVAVEAVGIKRRLPATVETTLFRIAQEALNNTAKYAQASNVSIHFAAADGEITLEVVDDGKGFDALQALKLTDGTRGLGLLGMRERAALVGGAVSITSQVGQGTRIRVTVPWGEQT